MSYNTVAPKLGRMGAEGTAKGGLRAGQQRPGPQGCTHHQLRAGRLLPLLLLLLLLAACLTVHPLLLCCRLHVLPLLLALLLRVCRHCRNRRRRRAQAAAGAQVPWPPLLGHRLVMLCSGWSIVQAQAR